MAQKPSHIIYGVDEKPPLWTTIIMGLQHVMVSAVTLILPVLIVQDIGGTAAQAETMVRMSLIAGGVGVVLQVWQRGPVGSGYLCPQLCGPAYFSASLLAARTGGLSLMFGLTLLAGVFEALFSRVVYRLRALFPTSVTGVVVVMVGFALVPIGVSNLLGLARTDTLSEMRELVIAILTLTCMIGLNVWGRGKWRLYSVLIGMGIGYLASWLMGLIPVADLDLVLQTAIFSVPVPGQLGWSFDAVLMLPFFISALASSLKAIGDLTTCQKINDADWQRPDMISVSRGLLADACGLAAAGLFGGMGQSSSSSSIGLSNATGVTSRYIGYAMGGVAITLAFIPKLAMVLVIMPKPVVGATLVFVASFMIVAGIQIIVSRLLDARKTFVVGVSMILGLSVDFLPHVYAHAPASVAPLLSSSLALSTLTALFLNLVFRLGVSNRARLELIPGEPSTDTIFAFFEAQGSAWGARRDVVYRAIAAMNELVEAITGFELAQSHIVSEVRFDEYNLDIAVQYQGSLIEFPLERPSALEMLNDEQAMAKLAGFLMRHYTDRIETMERDNQCHVYLHFDH
jgi:NCS2 family nucleobase:cation symporter-2